MPYVTVTDDSKLIVDKNTGEVSEFKKVVKTTNDSFAAMFAENMLAFGFPKQISAVFLAAIVINSTFFTKVTEKNITIEFSGQKRVDIKRITGLTENELKKQIQIAVDYGLLFKAPARGSYYVNYYLIFKGYEAIRREMLKRMDILFNDENHKWIMCGNLSDMEDSNE